MSKKNITHSIVQYFEDPKESKALAEIKRLSEQAKNRSSKNLIRIDSKVDPSDANTELNTNLNRQLFKENNNPKFQRRKFQFPTQIFQPSIANDLKKKANLKKWNLFDDDIEEEEKNDFITKKIKNKKSEKHVNFNVNKNNQNESIKENPKKKYDYNTFNAHQTKTINDNNNADLNNIRKKSSDDTEIITHQIVKYLDDPKNSEALARIKKLSNQAKNKTSNNLIHFNPYDIEDNKSKASFQRRKFQFPTQVYKPKQNNLTLIQELKVYKHNKDGKNNKNIIKQEENDSDVKSSEDDNSEFNLEKNRNDNEVKPEKPKYSNKTYDIGNKMTQKENTHINYNNYNTKYKNKPRIVNKEDVIEEKKEEIKEESKPEMLSNGNKYRKIDVRKNKIEPTNQRKREKYSSNTFDVDANNKNINRRKNFVERISYRFDNISEEYKKRNNLTVEKINNKEKIIKNVYNNQNSDKKKLKTYKTEYFWDSIINRLVEKRIYFDENETSKGINKNNNNNYSNNTYNPFNKYKKDLENKEKENNVTQEKIELDIDDKKEKEKEKDDTKNVVKETPDKKFVYSRKYKYKPHQYTTNTFNVTKNVLNNNTNINNNNKETKYQNETFKPNYRIYQKRQIITTKKEIPENNHMKNKAELKDNEEYNNINKAPKKEIEVRKKIIFSKKINPPVKSIVHGQSPTSKPSINNPEKNSKNEEIKFKKTTQPYSSANNNTKKKNIRLNMFSGEDDIFKETENELNKRNKNNIYANYMKNKNTTKNYQRPNRTQNVSELVEDLEKIEQYSVNTYLKNDLLEIYGNINEEFKNFKNDVFNTNLNDFEENMAVFDNKNSIRKKYKYNVKDLCKGKTTTDDIFRKYTKRAINIEKKEGFYNKK